MRLLPLLLVSLAACGGKIAPDPSAEARSAPSTEPSPSAIADAPRSTPPSVSIDAACNTVCERNARCGAGYKPDCVDRCLADASSRCAADAIAFTTCWARTLDDSCGELAPECEPAYCGYVACEGLAAPPYCR